MFKKANEILGASSKTIVRDLLFRLLILVLLIGGLGEITYYIYSERLAKAELNQRSDILIEELAAMLSVPLSNDNIQGVHHISSTYSQIAYLQGIRIADRQGQILLDTIKEGSEPFSRKMKIQHNGQHLGHVMIVVADQNSRQYRKQILIMMFSMGVVLVCFMVAGIHVIMHHILNKPLLLFNRGLSKIAEGNYSFRLEALQHADLNSSVQAVNSLAAHIEQVVGELSFTRDFLRSVLDSLPSIIIGVDQNCCITNMNFSAIRRAGKLGGECQGKRIADIFPGLEGEGMAIIQRSITEHLPITIEKKNCSVLGSKKYSEISVYPLNTSELDGAVVRIDDITARVRLQEVMVQTEKMMSVGGLGAGMAHEINNPLGGILQAAQNIERRLSPEFEKNEEIAQRCGIDLLSLQDYLQDRQIDTMLAGIRESGKRAAQIVQNMLQFSRRDNSVMEPCSLAGMLDRVIELAGNDFDLRRKYDFKNIRVVRNYQRDIDVTCSRTEMEQVFLNLLKNGAQAFGEFDKNRSHPPEITITSYQDEEYVTVEIADNGPGIEEEDQKRIFEPFFTTKNVGEGTGLGLAVSFFIVVDQHNGHLSVKSAPGQGATFIVQLPRR